jgi:hypothetical protein
MMKQTIQVFGGNVLVEVIKSAPLQNEPTHYLPTAKAAEGFVRVRRNPSRKLKIGKVIAVGELVSGAQDEAEKFFAGDAQAAQEGMIKAALAAMGKVMNIPIGEGDTILFKDSPRPLAVPLEGANSLVVIDAAQIVGRVDEQTRDDVVME